MNKCPCCGAPLERGAKLNWNAENRILTGSDYSVAFGPVRGKVFDALWRNMGKRGLSVSDLADIVYDDDPNGGPDWAHKSVHAMVHALRHELSHFGLQITSRSGPGNEYRLIGCAPEMAA